MPWQAPADLKTVLVDFLKKASSCPDPEEDEKEAFQTNIINENEVLQKV